jgi:hypothetical protein
MTQPVPQIYQFNGTQPFPYQDYIVIGFDTSPGKATIVNGQLPSDWDERKGYGLSGAFLWPKGDSLGSFSILFELWDEDDMPAWAAFYKKYFSQSAKLIIPGSYTPAALTIVHPVLLQVGMQECVVTGREVMRNDGYGLWSQVIHFKQYRKPKPAPQPAIAAIPGHAAPQPTAQSQLQKDNQALAAELNALVTTPPTPR